MMIPTLAIGALQTFHVRAGILTNYGADVFVYGVVLRMFRQGRTIFGRGRAMSAVATAAFIHRLRGVGVRASARSGLGSV